MPSKLPASVSLSRWPQNCHEKSVFKTAKVGSAKNKKVNNSKCGLLRDERGRGCPDFQIFPKFKYLKYDLDFYDIWDWYW